VKLVHGLFFGIEDGETRDAIIVIFLDHSDIFSTAGKGSFLVAAALATRNSASQWTIHRNQFGVSVGFLDHHLEGMDEIAEDPAAKVSVFERSSDMIITDEVLEFGLGFATQEFLQATTSSLTDFHFVGVLDVTLQGVGPAVHYFFSHDYVC